MYDKMFKHTFYHTSRIKYFKRFLELLFNKGYLRQLGNMLVDNNDDFLRLDPISPYVNKCTWY